MYKTHPAGETNRWSLCELGWLHPQTWAGMENINYVRYEEWRRSQDCSGVSKITCACGKSTWALLRTRKPKSRLVITTGRMKRRQNPDGEVSPTLPGPLCVSTVLPLPRCVWTAPPVPRWVWTAPPVSERPRLYRGVSVRTAHLYRDGSEWLRLYCCVSEARLWVKVVSIYFFVCKILNS